MFNVPLDPRQVLIEELATNICNDVDDNYSLDLNTILTIVYIIINLIKIVQDCVKPDELKEIGSRPMIYRFRLRKYIRDILKDHPNEELYLSKERDFLRSFFKTLRNSPTDKMELLWKS